MNEPICENVKHTSETSAFGQVMIHFWYGSKNNLKQGSLHLCDECSDKLIQLLKKEYGVKDSFLKPIIEM